MHVRDKRDVLRHCLGVAAAVDDSALQARGSEKQMTKVTVDAAKKAMGMFSQLRMVISVDKGQATATTDRIARNIAVGLSSRCLQSRRPVK